MNLQVFAERLSDLMFESNINPPILALKLKCSRFTINRYLSGRKMPSLDMTIKIAEYFNCSIDFLFGLESENYSYKYNKPPNFSQHFPKFLLKTGISRYYLHKITGVSESTLYYWIKGTKTPTIEKLIKISKSLNYSIDVILGRSK